MSIRFTHLKYGFLILAGVVGSLGASPVVHAAAPAVSQDASGNPNPRLKHPGAKAYGRTFGEWTVLVGVGDLNARGPSSPV